VKKILAPLFIALLSLGCATLFPTGNPEPVTETGTEPAAETTATDPGSPVKARAGEPFTIVIASNPSTGYHWELTEELSGIELVSRDYKADEPIVPGSGGVDIWTFKADSPGQFKLVFGSFPPSDPSEPEQTITFEVVVQ
jgi:predicted secreted protein